MRLLYLYSEEWTGRRAREVHTLSTCVALARAGVKVTLVTAGGQAELREHLHDVAGERRCARAGPRRAFARAGADPQHGDFLAQFQRLGADGAVVRLRLHHSPEGGGRSCGRRAFPTPTRRTRFRADGGKSGAAAEAARAGGTGAGAGGQADRDERTAGHGAGHVVLDQQGLYRRAERGPAAAGA